VYYNTQKKGEFPLELSEKIRALRCNLGLTYEEVGNFVGVGKSTVRKWETGMIENMRRDKIAKLAEVLQTTPGYLMGWSDSPDINKKPASKTDELREEIITKLLSMTEEQLKLVKAHTDLVEAAIRNQTKK
jgi:transcriptional regulator with XRE-family HTH domain